MKKGVDIRPFTNDDIGRISKIANDRRISDNLRDTFPHPYTHQDSEFFITEIVANQNPLENFAVCSDDVLVGTIGIHPLHDVYRNTGELGYWIGVDYWGQGIISKAIPLMLNYGFNTVGYHRIEAGVFDYNQGSIKALERNGFTLEGILREQAIKNGKFMDIHMYAKLKNN